MSERAQLRLIYLLFVFYICLVSLSFISNPGTSIKEINLIIEDTRYMENQRVMHIHFYKSKRVSLEGEWTFIPQGPLRTNVLLFDRTEPPDPQLESGKTYTILYFDTHIWRVFSIKEMI